MRLLVPAALLSLAVNASASLTPGDHTISIGERSYIAHIPPAAVAARPVVINLHGGGSNAAQQQKYSQMDTLADREHFIVVYPDGTGRMGMHVWNAGTCCGAAAEKNIDDVAFIRSVIDDLGRRTPIDRKRIYATGMSNGAMMTYRLAAEASDLIAAAAPVAGAMILVNFHPKLPVPIMHMHSVDDPRALYNGGLGPPFPMTNSRVFHRPVEEQLAKWIAFNRCPKTATVQRKITGSTTTATKDVYTPCATGATVVLWKLTGSGHVWPGSEGRPAMQRILGRPNTLINANEEMWTFFKSFHR
jgi:polyhydroxybutyrate depolymerase